LLLLLFLSYCCLDDELKMCISVSNRFAVE